MNSENQGRTKHLYVHNEKLGSANKQPLKPYRCPKCNSKNIRKAIIS